MLLQYLRRDKSCMQSKTFWSFFHVFLCIKYRHMKALQQIIYDDILKDPKQTTIKRLKKTVGCEIFLSEYEIFDKACVAIILRLEKLPFPTQKKYLFELEGIYSKKLSSEQVRTLIINMWAIQKRWLMNQV